MRIFSLAQMEGQSSSVYQILKVHFGTIYISKVFLKAILTVNMIVDCSMPI